MEKDIGMDPDSYNGEKIHVQYMSGWYTILLPTLTFLITWIGSFVGIGILLKWKWSDLLAVILLFICVLPGLIIAVATYPFFMTLARQGYGEIRLEGDRLHWRKGFLRHTLDLTQPYRAEIRAGLSGLGKSSANIIFSNGLMVHLKGASRDDVLHFFPEPYFVDTLAIQPEEGLWGFSLSGEDSVSASFFARLLQCLWNNRHQNERFCIYEKFPWHRSPHPSFQHIYIIDLKARPGDRTFLDELKVQAFISYGDVQVTPDYLIGRPDKLLKGKSHRLGCDYCIMPLGYITAEVDIKPSLEESFLYVYGVGEDGAHLKVVFGWYRPTYDKGEDEAKFILRFIQAMHDILSSN